MFSNRWKLQVVLLALLLPGSTALAQVTQPPAYNNSIIVNYVREWDAKAPVQDSGNLESRPVTDVAKTTKYLDGLGRPIETVGWQVSPAGNDMVTAVVYDAYGREQYKYLPFASNLMLTQDVTNDGAFKIDPFQQQAAFSKAQYPNENYYYGQINFEASPLNRVVNSYSPGISWVGGSRGVSNQYLVNTASDSVQQWNISLVPESIPTSAGPYLIGQLYKNVTIDEQGHSVIEYKDNEGRVILKKVQLAASPGTGHIGWLCTYYVYDNLDNLRFVIQPQAVALVNGSWTISTAIENELCFRYEYDQRNRMSIKKVPGAGELWMVYDARDRLVMSQDSNLRVLGKWQVTEYDSLNRPWRTGLLTDPNNQAYHQNLAYNSITYPNTTGSNYEVLTQTYYDNYTWVTGATSALSASMATNNTTNSNYFITNYNSLPTYAVPMTPLSITQGMVTGSMRKVIGTASQYLYGVNFYDDHSREIQTQTLNYTGAVDTMTTQYDFSGKPLRSLLSHKKDSNTVQSHTVVTKMDYDAGFRLRHIWKNIDGATSDQLIDSLQYNELGQLIAKYLGNNVDSLLYTYNIRGWLTGINPNYVAGTTNHYFGMELGYDKTISVAPGNTYLTPEYNGNIEGTVWKSAGSGVNRKYDFSYDNASRLIGANFNQYNGSGFDKSANIDFSVSNLNYDANGNILTMSQRGFTVGGSSVIDSLTYKYLNSGASNRLQGVTDAVNNNATLLGDFHYNPITKQATDYSYDGNGNLNLDNNKLIDTIVYNYLNLPQLVHMNGKGNIQYVYDAAGNKLAKFTTDSLARHFTSTLYIGGFVYQQNDTIIHPAGGADTLQFIGHEEGRARWAYHKYTTGATAYKFEYDFFEKDHLGNTRMLLSQERDTTNYLASMEYQFRTTEVQLFGNITNTCVAWNSMPNYQSIPNNLKYGITSPNDSVSKVDFNGTTGQETGPSLLLKVMSGDSVKLMVQSYYVAGTGTTNNSSFSSVLNSLAGGLANITSGAHGALSNLTASNSSVYTGLTNFLSGDESVPSGYPKAYLNWIFLDDQFNYVSSLSGAVAAASSTYPAGTFNTVAPGSQLALNKSGYLYIWVSNETQGWDVFFDNLSVQYKQGPLLEENHYYPFGLTMAGISDKAIKMGYAENKYRYNSGSELANKEFSDGAGLEMYETDFRGYDPQIGRFWQPDPIADIFENWSPYSFAADNPILLDDPLGLAPNDSTAHDSGVKPMEAVTVTAKKKDCKTCDAPSVAAGIPQINPSSPLRIVPKTPPGKVIPMDEPSPEFSPALAPVVVLTGILTVFPWQGGPSFPNGDEGYYLGGKHMQPAPAPLPGQGDDNDRDKPQYLVRFGNSSESMQQLEAQAAAAYATGRFPFGVSTRLKTRISGSDRNHRSALMSEVMKFFRVEKTGLDPLHYTVVLPNPMTQEATILFNSLFKTP